MRNDGLSSKQVGTQASRRVTLQLAWIQPVCITINAVPALKGLTASMEDPSIRCTKGLNKYYCSFHITLSIKFWR